MYPAHIQRLQGARIDAANALHDAEARCRALFVDGLTTEHDAALKAVNAARFALYDTEQALSIALTARQREGEDDRDVVFPEPVRRPVTIGSIERRTAPPLTIDLD